MPVRSRDAGLRVALERAATYGPFFVLDLEPTGTGWQPVDDATVAGYAETTAARLTRRFGHPPEPRVVGSLAHLALASRLLSPTLVAAAHGLVPDCARANLVWRPDREGPVPMALTEARATEVRMDPAAAADAIAGSVLPTVAWLGERLAPDLAPGLLAGNVASAIATAARLAPVAAEVGAALLALPSLRDAGAVGPGGYRRRSCCLYYRLEARAGLCEDCGLAR